MAYLYGAKDILARISYRKLEETVSAVDVTGYGSRDDIITIDHANGKPNRSHSASAVDELKAAKAFIQGKRGKISKPIFGTRIKEGYEIIRSLLK
jgi:hypothetical protein